MKRQDISQASTLETKLQRLERERWAIAHLSSMNFRITQANGSVNSSEAAGDDDLLPAWEAGLLEVSLSTAHMPAVRAALVKTYSLEIDRIKERLRKIGVDPEPDDL